MIKKTKHLSHGFKTILCFIIMLANLFFNPQPGHTAYKINLSPIKLLITPFVSLQEEYNDNIYLSRFERSDWITTASPGINISLFHPRGAGTTPEGLENQLLSLTYSPGFVYFLHNPQHDYTSHTQDLSINMGITPRLTFSLEETYIRTNDPRLTQIFLDLDDERSLRSDSRYKRNMFMVMPRLAYQFGSQNSFTLSYRFSALRSENPTDDDYREQYINTSLYYWFNLNNGVNLIFDYTKGNFDLYSDLLDGYGLTCRYIHIFSPKLEVYGEGSVELLDYEETLRRGSGIHLEKVDAYDEDIYNTNLGFTYTFSPTLSATGAFGYFWQKGYRNRDEDGFNAMFGLTKRFKKVDISLQYRKGHEVTFFSLADSGSYRFWEVSVELAYHYSSRLEFSLTGSYGHRVYSSSRSSLDRAAAGDDFRNRDDYIYRSSFLINYQLLKNVSLELEAEHNENDSSRYIDYYIINRFSGRITVTF